MTTKMRHTSVFRHRPLAAAVLAALAGFGQIEAKAATLVSTACLSPSAGTSTCYLWARTGSTTLPGGASVPVWGYSGPDPATLPPAPGPIAPAAASVTQVGGPTLIVNQGDVVTVHFTNNLAEPSALLFQGQTLPPDTAGAAAGGTKDYTFTAGAPGTYLYEASGLMTLPSGHGSEHQAAMGLYGALIVRPATPNQAYTDTATAYSDEALVLLSEIDPALNASPGTFDLRNYAPKYFLINGKAHPQTDPITTAAAYTTSPRVLLRYVNAGLKHHSMAVLGLQQTVVAQDGGRLRNTADISRTVVADTIAPGQTQDAIVAIPASTVAGVKFPLYDASLLLNNNGASGFGGMLTFLSDGNAAPPNGSTLPTPPPPVSDTVGPTTSGLTLAPNPTNGSVSVALGATADDTATGNSNIAGASYAIDGACPASASPCAMTVTPTAPIASLAATIPQAAVNGLAEGSHPVTVTSTDAATPSNTGPSSAALNLIVDKTGPTAGGLLASPNPTNGVIGYNNNTPAVRFSATLTDSVSTIASAEGFIDTVGAIGTGFPFAPGDGQFNGTTEAAYADIPLTTIRQLSDSPHTLYVRGKDAAGNWGPTSTTTLTVDKTQSVYFSTTGNVNPPGVGGTADDADIYFWNGTAFSRVIDASGTGSLLGLQPGANIDGFVRVDASHFYLSFSAANTSVPTLGNVQDEDIVYYNAGAWSVYFDGTARGLTNINQNIDAFSLAGTNIYFSMAGNSNPPGVGGTADDADIYLWNGTAFSRVVDATTIGVPAGANVDGLKFVDATHFYLSFTDDTTLTSLSGITLTVQDEDVVFYNNGTWSVYFDGTGKGLTNSGHDIDAFDIP